MTKNASSKKEVREYAKTHGLSYTAALRDFAGASTQISGAVTVTYTFRGDGAPSQVSFDAAPWMRLLARDVLDSLRDDDWTYDPASLAPGYDYLPDLLGAAARQGNDPVVVASADWVRANPMHWAESFEVPDRDSLTGMRRVGDSWTTEPIVVTFDRAQADRWFARHAPSTDPSISDFVTPSEKRNWLTLYFPSHLDCAEGRHFFDGSPSPFMGECVACGALMLVRHDSQGEQFEAVVDEAAFAEEVFATEAFCNWAPPSASLRGETQAEWRGRMGRTS